MWEYFQILESSIEISRETKWKYNYSWKIYIIMTTVMIFLFFMVPTQI